MSKELHKTPAELYFIQDEVTAWCFNRAVTTFGRELDADLANAESKAKNSRQANRMRKMVMDKWMTLGIPDAVSGRKFADPAGKLKKESQPKDTEPADRPERPEFMRDS